MIHKPIVIVGAGPVGMTIAIKLAKAGYKEITLLDANVPNNILAQQDGRVLALSYASRQILESIKAWDNDCATAITQVHISHSGLGISTISSQDVTLPELGYTIKYSDLCTKLYQCTQQYPEIKLAQALVSEVIPGKNYATIVYNESETLTANWVILAEGGKIKPHQVEYKEYDYKQSAIIVPLKITMAKSNIAFERFDDNGALVLLPYKDEYILVWSVDQTEQESLKDPEQLTRRLNQLNFMQRFGQFKVNGKIHSFPLGLQVAKKRVINRVILVGNSAQIVHPISAQGLNLGLRDAETLVELMSNNTVAAYEKMRRLDSQFVITFTHFLARFTHLPYTRHLRGIGLITLSNFKPLQNKLANSLIFGN